MDQPETVEVRIEGEPMGEVPADLFQTHYVASNQRSGIMAHPAFFPAVVLTITLSAIAGIVGYGMPRADSTDAVPPSPYTLHQLRMEDTPDLPAQSDPVKVDKFQLYNVLNGKNR